MPILAVPPPQAAVIRPFWNLDESPCAHGIEGQQIQHQFDEVSKHWLMHFGGAASTAFNEDAPYRNVPFERVGMRRVRYRAAKALPVMRIDFDDEE
ncbi:MAG: hypothetical protein SH850_25550 [Planctomycetaceae bacterium]|nr:hypothetical protein [Planctomycetaceae bacterium]